MNTRLVHSWLILFELLFVHTEKTCQVSPRHWSETTEHLFDKISEYLTNRWQFIKSFQTPN